jgi:hypothetical protein
MSGFGGMHVGNRLGILQVHKMLKIFDAKLLPSGKHGATTENTKDTLTLLLKMVLTEFWSKVGM